MESPRIEDGVIKWYCGDIFYISFEVLDDKTGEPLELSQGDAVIIRFYDRQGLLVKQFEFVNGKCDDLTCYIDKNTSERFRAGKYTYCIKYHCGDLKTETTVKALGECEVERCH